MSSDVTNVIPLPTRPGYSASRILREKAISLLLQWETLASNGSGVDASEHARLVEETRQIRQAVVATERRRYEALQAQVAEALEGLNNGDLTQAQRALQVLRGLVRD